MQEALLLLYNIVLLHPELLRQSPSGTKGALDFFGSQITQKTGTMSKDEHRREEERWFVSTSSCWKSQITERGREADGYRRERADGDGRDPPPVRGKTRREKASIKVRCRSSDRPNGWVRLHIRAYVWLSKVC